MEKIRRLVELQNETHGASFVLGFSTRKQQYYIHFNNIKKKRITANKVENVVDLAIIFIMDNRKRILETDKYTLYNEI